MDAIDKLKVAAPPFRILVLVDRAQAETGDNRGNLNGNQSCDRAANSTFKKAGFNGMMPKTRQASR